MVFSFGTADRPVHYWVGRGTLCSLDNSVRQQKNHATDKAMVTCQYCRFQLDLNKEAVR
jgi:hypothetical protein